MNPNIVQKFGNKVRVRACGLCWQQDSLLLISHSGLGPANFWAPPGGGIEFGQSAMDALAREMAEETGLEITVLGLQFTCEFVKPPLHAIELFFNVKASGGSLRKGTDPELDGRNQIIREVRFLSWAEIQALEPSEKHGVLRFCQRADDLRKLTGFYRI
ncbi:MAG: NUDIX domain-containing protein [Cyclobacteriaceae bacterium]